MSEVSLLVAIIAGVIQGIFEWLPISSQGNLSLALTMLGTDPATALQLALFLQVGTTVSAASYYREELIMVLRQLPRWRPQNAFAPEHALLSYLLVATLCTGVVGIPLYITVIDLATALTGGVFVAGIGVLLLLTGLLHIASNRVGGDRRADPGLADAIIVGALQGMAILPGISRSGVTAGGLLLRQYEPPAAFRLSFILSIPASVGAAGITLVDAGGLPGLSPLAAAAALAISAVVGVLTIDAIMRVVSRVPFWAVCIGLGGLALIGGGMTALL